MAEQRQDLNPSETRGRKRSPRLAAAAVMAAVGAVWAALPAAGGANFWTSAGPNGGGVVALVPDPADPHVLYAATTLGGVFKSTDGGASWQGANRGLTDHRMLALAVDPLANETLYAASNDGKRIFVSHDGAATWAAAAPFAPGTPGLDVFVSSLAVDPTHAGTVYAGSGYGLWVSNDGGGSWNQVFDDQPSGGVLVAADPTRSAVFALVGEWQYYVFDYYLFDTTDGGVTWNDRSASLPAMPLGYVKIGFAIEPAAPATLYIAVTRTEADTGRLIPKTFRSADGGATWQGAGTGGVPLAAAASGLVLSGGSRSTDHGVTWTPIAPPPDTVQSYTIAPGGVKIYAAGAALGVLASTDGARSWQLANQGLGATSLLAFAADPQSPGTLYAAAEDLGLLKSRDSGKSWRLLDTGLPPPGNPCCTFSGAVLAADPAASGTLFYVVGVGQGALHESADAGASWTQLPLGYVVSVVPDPSSPAVLYALADANCGVQKSTDGGQHWGCLSLPYFAAELVVSPAAPATLYALTTYSSPHAVWKSTDAGASWAPIDAGLPLARELIGSSRGHLAIDPTNAARLYVSGPSGVWMTQDGGAHWSRKSHGLPRAADAPRLAIDPHSPLVLVAADASIGVYRSRDGGSHWQPILAGLPPLGTSWYTTLAVDPAVAGSVYLGTLGNGLLTYTAAP